MTTKEKLMQLLELCIKKGLNFDYSPDTKVCVNKSNEKYDGWKFYEYEFLLSSINNDENKTLDNLITKVKNYQP